MICVPKAWTEADAKRKAKATLSGQALLKMGYAQQEAVPDIYS